VTTIFLLVSFFLFRSSCFVLLFQLLSSSKLFAIIIQSNTIQSNTIQSNPIQSNPIQYNPIQYNPKLGSKRGFKGAAGPLAKEDVDKVAFRGYSFTTFCFINIKFFTKKTFNHSSFHFLRLFQGWNFTKQNHVTHFLFILMVFDTIIWPSCCANIKLTTAFYLDDSFHTMQIRFLHRGKRFQEISTHGH
jgi:hypothetical protein